MAPDAVLHKKSQIASSSSAVAKLRSSREPLLLWMEDTRSIDLIYMMMIYCLRGNLVYSVAEILCWRDGDGSWRSVLMDYLYLTPFPSALRPNTACQMST